MDKIFVTIFGVGLIGFIYWFFFGGKKDVAETEKDGSVNITVDGGYKPSVIKLKRNRPVVLRILRKDPNSCLEEIVLSDFKTRKYLPLNRTVEIKLNPDKSGEFPFHCGMNMYHGKILVE